MLKRIVNGNFLTIYGLGNNRAFASTWHVPIVLNSVKASFLCPQGTLASVKEISEVRLVQQKAAKTNLWANVFFPRFCRGFHYLNRIDPNFFFIFFSQSDCYESLNWFLLKYWGILSILSIYWVYIECFLKVCATLCKMSHLNLQ